MSAYTRPKKISLKSHAIYTEGWVQDIIADDPSILGLGDLVLRDRERIHPKAGRLDLLLQDPESLKRYEVELQLGATDEAHIIRSIEYWDIERKRYPQYEHCAVLIAENITSRFLNVVSLFNGALPIIAIQLQAFQVGEHVTLVFTKVLDELQRGLVDEDEDAISAPTDRAYWENEKGTKKTIALMDRLFELVKEGDPEVELKYNKFYVGLVKDGRADNYVQFRPQKTSVKLEVRLPRSDEIDTMLEEAEIETLEYASRWARYRIRVTDKDLRSQGDLIRKLIVEARENSQS
jgi:predicted transport protein